MKRAFPLSVLLLPLFLLSGAALHGQTAADTLRHRPTHGIGIDLHSGYVFPGVHLKYAFRFSPQSRLGRLYPSAYQGIGMAWNTFFNADEVGTPSAIYVFQGARIARLAPRLTLDYEWNFGASFGWQKYDPEANR